MDTKNQPTNPNTALSQQLLGMLLLNCYTTHKLNKRLRVLKGFLSEKIFHSQLENSESDDEEIEWISNLDQQTFEPITKDNFTTVFVDLETQAKAMKILIIYFPIQIPGAEIDRLGAWLRENFSKNILFENRLDPNLLAGAAVVWNGVYRDYSVRAKLQAKKAQIIDSLKSFRLEEGTQ